MRDFTDFVEKEVGQGGIYQFKGGENIIKYFCHAEWKYFSANIIKYFCDAEWKYFPVLKLCVYSHSHKSPLTNLLIGRGSFKASSGEKKQTHKA